MARRPLECLICYPDTCSCFAKPTKVARVKPVVAPVVEVTPFVATTKTEPSAALLAMRAAASAARVVTFENKHTVPPIHPVRRASSSVEDVLLAQALRAIGSIMHPDERTKYRMVLSSVPSIADRATAWRAGHGG